MITTERNNIIQDIEIIRLATKYISAAIQKISNRDFDNTMSAEKALKIIDALSLDIVANCKEELPS